MDLSTRQGRREQGQRIQRAVERAGLSIEELAGRIGCSRALIYQYLSGTTLSQPDRLQRIAAECGVPLSYFFAEDENEQQAPAADSGAAVSDSTESAEAAREVEARLRDSLQALQDLADAQAGPADYRALASTCERILSLASQMGDRTAQASAQFRLGNARLRCADYPRAGDALRNAIALASQIGANEIATNARQSLGAALVSMGNIPAAREQFALIAAGTDFSGRWQGTVSLGGIYTLQGDYQQAMQHFDDAADILEEGESTGAARPEMVATGLLYVNANRTNVYLNGGDFEGARRLAERCLETAESLGVADQHLEARFNLAWCDLHVGRWERAHRGLFAMLRLARFINDQGRETMARAWTGIFLAAAGDYGASISCGKDALSLALSRGDRRAELYAQLALADAYTAETERDSEARYHTNQALAVATALRQDRAEIECRLRLARLGVQCGEWGEARDAASRALSLSERLGARHLESLARCWLAETLIHEQVDTARAYDELQQAASAADEIGLVEGQWRSRCLMANLALNSGGEGATAAEGYLRQSISTLDSLRVGLRDAGLADTLLENEDCLAVYASYATQLVSSSKTAEAQSFLDQAGWPPLTARVAMNGTHATS